MPHGRLFAVGDDWQSIYRFTGSDVNIITDLPSRVGATARVDLDTAFRTHVYTRPTAKRHSQPLWRRACWVHVLGRNNFSEPERLDDLKPYWQSKEIKFEFSTAHSSKGKERDFVIIVGMEAGEFGFPSNVADDPVIKMVLAASEAYPFAEERRLFYVTITRARKHVYVVAQQDKASPFVIDDLLVSPLDASVIRFGEVSQRVRCPNCSKYLRM